MKVNRKIDYVYVLSIDGKPLMPTKRFRKVRLWLKTGQAKIVRRDVFTIQLLFETSQYVQYLTLGCDTGYEHIGLSASNDKAEYYAEETIIDNGMIKRLEVRKANRRDRRSRKTEYRQARFDNRVLSKKEGWLSPSVRHRRDTHLNRINFICTILPISKIIVETTSFDVQKIKNPDIAGIEYQKGDTFGFENKRQYILHRDGFKCQHCGCKNHLEVHHIKFKSQGGTNDINNLITLCHDCHHKLHENKFKIKKIKSFNFKAAAGVQTMKKSLIKMLNEFYKNVEETFGYITKINRIQHNIEKSHSNDAFAIAGNFDAKRLMYHYKFVQKKRHERSIHLKKFAKGGIRRSNIAPKNIAGSIFKKGDFVLYNGIKCFISGSSNGYVVLKDINLNKVIKEKISYKKLKFIRRQQGQYFVDIVY
ncbi:MAG: HNH endonuclease [Wendovervirus sonii]|uniref:HNH endonuclease n=1 Tax=phage Lak_Megaphage_Sonny TaxID=3109229 RepID=A0ABZ0Z419_9CAUD|nr:MAG: HNH endonuclease [phage Lak_Megaphage_Sonny]